jgi:alkanesulfonate monooxygenase SsuD/methylene tetrahydromethanopterin reductase-like flavin-dependent oxidoreductase (luciferase family)
LAHIRDVARYSYGRELQSFRAILNCWINVGNSVDAARAEGKAMLEAYHQRPVDDDTLERWLIYGPPDVCAERLEEYVSAGVTGFLLVIASVDQVGQMRAIGEQVRPRVGLATAPHA